ncbi:hypothetical protein [Psychrobacter sanguinis]|uniref:hypothetical protein n=1 Tax=Psychrobacter sanguinis TaxID=861445 RepID=UPI0019186213|nr:hypothetical protein [Psychrobacter sanguinis]MCC3344515.1 hypothetical protein [Psychrobacter sanguinis]
MSMPSNELRQKILSSIDSHLNDYPEVAERWRAGDPTVRAMMTAVVETVIWLSRDNVVNITEPFIKSRQDTIIADAINKGILPVATPCQHLLTVENRGEKQVSLSQGRLIEDGTGRQWRIMASITVQPKEVKTVLAEQSTVNNIEVTIPVSESFYRLDVATTDNAYFSGLSVVNATLGINYQYTPKFMNAGIGQPTYTLQSNNLEDITIVFGDSQRAGTTAQAGDTFEIAVTQSYGYVDQTTLSSAALSEIYTAEESKLVLYFKAGDIVRAGADPLTVAQLRLLASYPAMYDQNAVFMGNFDFLIRKHFMQRFDYMAVWNETINEKHYGPSLDAINHLFLTVVAKNKAEQQLLIDDINKLIARADTLLKDRIYLKPVAERPFKITISGQLASVHDMDSVKTQIKELLLENFGKGALASSYHNPDGFNKQEIAIKIRNDIVAFQDRISDFSIFTEDTAKNPIKPHEWAYITESSLTINLTRTADTGTAIWTL